MGLRMPTYLASQQVLGHGGHIRRGHWEHLLSLEKSYQKITRKYNNLCIAIESLQHIWCSQCKSIAVRDELSIRCLGGAKPVGEAPVQTVHGGATRGAVVTRGGVPTLAMQWQCSSLLAVRGGGGGRASSHSPHFQMRITRRPSSSSQSLTFVGNKKVFSLRQIPSSPSPSPPYSAVGACVRRSLAAFARPNDLVR